MTFDGTYTQLEQIGRGGTGEIYRAYHANLKKYVVIKRITIDMSRDKARREVDILKNLKHRYLPTIYDFFEINGGYYIVEDYIEGVDLSAFISTRTYIPEKLAVKWMKQLCEVLEYLHTRTPAVVHSDIKPGNIMIDTNDDLCLIDFNISVLSGEKRDVLGYSNYFCAPEQIAKATIRDENIRIDNRADIYSACATFYTLLSGVVPFSDRSNRPLTSMNLNYSEGFLALIDKGMTRKVNERWQSGGQMLRHFEHLERLTVSWKRKKRIVSLLAVFAAVTIACTSFGVFYSLKAQRKSRILSIENSYNLNGATKEIYSEAEKLTEGGVGQSAIDTAQLYIICAEYQFNYGSNNDSQSIIINAKNDYHKAFELIKSEQYYFIKEQAAANYIACCIKLKENKSLTESSDEYIFLLSQGNIYPEFAKLMLEKEDFAKKNEKAKKLLSQISERELKSVMARNMLDLSINSNEVESISFWARELYNASPLKVRDTAAALFNAGCFEEALQYYSKITESSQTGEDALAILQIYCQTGEKNIAAIKSAIQKVKTQADDNFYKYYLLSCACYVLLNDYAEARRYCSQAGNYSTDRVSKQDLENYSTLKNALGI